MAKRLTRKELLKTDEITEAAFDFGHWIEHNWRVVVRWVGAAVVVAIVIAGFMWMRANNRAEGLRLLADAQRLYSVAETGNFLNDDDTSAALDAFEVAIAHSGTSNPGLLAQYYKSVALKRLGRSAEAITTLEDLTGTGAIPLSLRGQAELLLASLYTEAGRGAEAVELLTAATTDENTALPPEQALLEIGRIHRELGDLESARAAWQRVVDEYGQTPASGEARQLIGPDAG